MSTRVKQAALVGGFLARESRKFLRGEPHFLTELHTQAWYSSSAKKLPSVATEEIFPGLERLPVELVAALAWVGGNVSLAELVILAGICRAVHPEAVFEFGTFNGRTTVNFAANTPANGIVYTLDIPPQCQSRLPGVPSEEVYQLGDQVGEFYRGSAYAQKVRQLWSDSAAWDETVLRGQVEVVFVDGSHSYAYVKNDTEKGLRLLKHGGFLLWHDYYYGWPDVVRYLHERAEELNICHLKGTSLAITQAQR